MAAYCGIVAKVLLFSVHVTTEILLVHVHTGLLLLLQKTARSA